MVFMGSAIPQYLCLNAMFQVFDFAANIMFITSIIKISVVHSQESFPTRIRATAYSIAMSFGHIGDILGTLFSQALVHWNFNVLFSLILGFVVFASLLLFISKKEANDLPLEHL